jgi:hypothetical protein
MGNRQKNVLSKEEVNGMKPVERERYVQDVLLGIFEGDKIWTIREIIEKTALARPTVTKHLHRLVDTQQISSDTKMLGNFSVTYYKKSGNIDNKKELQRKFSGPSNYVFFTIDTDDEHSICIQQKDKDDFGIEKVKGAIVVSFEDFELFLKELHAYAAKVIQK